MLRHRIALFGLFLVLLTWVWGCYAQGALPDVAARNQANGSVPVASRPMLVRIESNPDAHFIHEGLLGANNLYWVDDDAAWANAGFVGQLREFGVRALRYPGGEVADNYDWETNRVERPDKFPREAKSEKARAARLDYKEFLAHAKAAGIPNLFFVVNLEGAVRRPGNLNDNLNLYADKAARWVKAVREAGYRVEYWEIGNESHLRSLPALSAQGYARALKIFSRKMKAVDPSIKIGAIGPHAFRGKDAIGVADRPGASGAPACGAAESGAAKAQDGAASCAGKGFNAEGLPVWWDVVTKEAGDSFDFVAIHRYRMAAVKNGGGGLGEYIGGLKRYIESRKGAPIQLALTEWNTPNQANQTLSESDHALEIAEQFGSYLEGGVDFTMYWPMRLRGDTFNLLTFATMQPTPSLQTLALVRRYFGDRLAATAANDDGDMYILATKYAAGHKVLLVNKAKAERCVEFAVEGKPAKVDSGEVYSDIRMGASPRSLSSKELRNDARTVCIPPRAIAGVSTGR